MEDLQLFCEQLVRLNATMKELFDRGDLALILEMHAAIKEMHRLERVSTNPVFQSLQRDTQIVYKNFDMILAVLKTTENDEIDEGAQGAINRLLHNIDTAVIDIATILKLI